KKLLSGDRKSFVREVYNEMDDNAIGISSSIQMKVSASTGSSRFNLLMFSCNKETTSSISMSSSTSPIIVSWSESCSSGKMFVFFQQFLIVLELTFFQALSVNVIASRISIFEISESLSCARSYASIRLETKILLY